MNRQTWLDRAISWMSPKWGLERSRARMAAGVLMAYEGARTLDLNALGADRWELVAAIPQPGDQTAYYFKRRK